MIFSNLLHYPAYYRERNKNLNNVILSNIKYNLDQDNNIIISANTDKYFLTILFKNVKITPNTKIFVDCNCKSFQFEFSSVIGKNNSLLYPERYSNTQLPKNRNEYRYLTGCKHLMVLGRFIYSRKTFFEEQIRRLYEGKS